jgi:hypothetical protein
MKRILPGRVELAVLAAVAVLGALALAWVGRPEKTLAIVAFPLLLGAMLMGARRAGKLSIQPKKTLDARKTEPVE